MELQQYLRILQQYWRSALATFFICIALAAVITLVQTPKYEATSSMFFTVDSGANAGELSNGATYAERTVTSYVQVATTAMVLNPVIKDLGLDTTPEELAKNLTVTSPTGTSIIKVTASDDDSQTAAKVADAVADSLLTTVKKLSPSGPTSNQLVQATVINEAVAPTSASSPRPLVNLALGALIGLVLGVGQAVLRSVLDNRIRTADDLEETTDAPILASITHRSDSADRAATDSETVIAEDYRRLRTNIGFVGLGGERRSSMVVTSSMPGEGKTETSTNLARVLAQAGERVLLIDADLRRPQVAPRMRLDNGLGLSDVLTGRGQLEDLVIEVTPGFLSVLPAGTVPPNPSELLGSDAMERLLAALEARYDYIIVDTPPLLPVADASILAPKTGGAVVVTRARKTRKGQLAHALSLLNTSGATTLGVVLNDASPSGSGNYSYHGSYAYTSTSPANTQATRA